MTDKSLDVEVSGAVLSAVGPAFRARVLYV
jgi:hypothetical protein